MDENINAFVRIHALASLMRERKSQNEPPYVLLLGAGASLASGASSMERIIDRVLEQVGAISARDVTFEEKLGEFYRCLDEQSASERYQLLAPHFQNLEPSIGYRQLAQLIKAGYLDVVLSTNLDLLLEDALRETGASEQEVKKLVCGETEEAQLAQALEFVSPQIKLVKLHGDLNAHQFAFTEAEIVAFSPTIERSLAHFLERRPDLIVAGHSLRDPDLNRCLESSIGALWYANPNPVLPSGVAAQMARSKRTRIISGEEGKFDAFMCWLRLELLLPPPSAGNVKQDEQLNALREAEVRGDRREMAKLLSALGTLSDESGNTDLAELCYERGAALYEEMQLSVEQAKLLRNLGHLNTRLNRIKRANEAYEHAEQVARRAQDPVQLALSEAALGQWWWLVRKSRRRTGQGRIDLSCVERAIEKWKTCLPALEASGRPEAAWVRTQLARAEQQLASITQTKVEQARLVALSGPLDSVEWIIYKPETTIGRSAEQDICLAQDSGVAARHARVLMEEGHYWFEDLDNATGSYMGECNARIRRPVEWVPGTVIRVGPSTRFKLDVEVLEGEAANSHWIILRIEELLHSLPAEQANEFRRELTRLGEEKSTKGINDLLRTLGELARCLQGGEDELADEAKQMGELSTFIDEKRTAIVNQIKEK